MPNWPGRSGGRQRSTGRGGRPDHQLPSTPEQAYRFGGVIEEAAGLPKAALATGSPISCPTPTAPCPDTPLVWNVADEVRRSLPLTAAAKFLRRPQVLESSVADGKLPFVGGIPLDQEADVDRFPGQLSKVTHRRPFRSSPTSTCSTANYPIWCGASWFRRDDGGRFADDYWTRFRAAQRWTGSRFMAISSRSCRPSSSSCSLLALLAALIYASGAIAFLALSLLHHTSHVVDYGRRRLPGGRRDRRRSPGPAAGPAIPDGQPGVLFPGDHDVPGHVRAGSAAR